MGEQKIKVKEQVLTVSTANICEETMKWLGEQANTINNDKAQLNIYPKGKRGWLIPLSDDMLEGVEAPNDLLLLIGYALGADCSWIILEQDVDIMDRLQKCDY